MFLEATLNSESVLFNSAILLLRFCFVEASKTSLILVDQNGEIVAEGETGPSNPWVN